jgi:hypothetical protein
MSRLDYAINGRQAARFPTLTEELSSIGVSHVPCSEHGRRQLVNAQGENIGMPVCSAAGWHFVRLVRCGALRSTDTVRDAIDCAGLELLG